MTSATRWAAIGGALCWRPRRACWYTSGRFSATIESIWPSFMMAPFMPPRSSKTCSAVWTWNSSSSSSPARRARSWARATARRMRQKGDPPAPPGPLQQDPRPRPPHLPAEHHSARRRHRPGRRQRPRPRASFARRDGRHTMRGTVPLRRSAPAGGDGRSGRPPAPRSPPGASRLRTGEPGRAEEVDGLRRAELDLPGAGGDGRPGRTVEPLLPLAPPTRAASLAPPGSRVTGAAGAPPAPDAAARPAPDLGRRLARPGPVRLPGPPAPRRRRGTFFSRQVTNWPSSFVTTSAITPRPNWAARPVMARSVTTFTLVPSPSAVQRGGDGGVGVALAPGVAALGPQHRLVGGVVLLDEGRLALVLGGDRADLHLDDAPVFRRHRSLAARRRACRARSARRRSAASRPRRPRRARRIRSSAP